MFRSARLAVARARGGFVPEVVVFDLTHRCNSRCVGCDYREPEPDELSVTQWTWLAREAAGLGFDSVLLTGGEPLVHPRIKVLLPAIAAELPVDLHTNGLLLKRHAEIVVEHVRSVFVSVDGADDATYRSIRGVGLRPVLNGVDAVRASIPVHVRVTVWQGNLDQLVAIADLCMERGLTCSYLAADTVSDAFGREGGAVNARGARMPDPVLEQLHAHPAVDQSWESLLRLQTRDTTPTCNAPWTSGVVSSTGAWAPCFFLEAQGDVEDGLGAAIRTARSARRGLDLDRDPICRRCVCWRG